jgi:glutamyl-tRNA(Gln) amidotransferase subunit E
MKKRFDPLENYNQTKKQVGYVPRKKASQSTYDEIGFMSGLEVHQQLLTDKKLFCNCPAGIFQKADDFDAEIIRHMRPTLSELGGYDGTALMEFRTRKNIVYRIKNKTACTYEVDDTPPFPINRQAVERALKISLLTKLNIVGEIHITRKQYLDGSIPTGFQRTAILGVEGSIPLKNKTVRIIQLSIEEDSCREVSDIGHTRVYRTDRLGMPLIETVTYPDMVNPAEVMEACNYIRFLNRSTGLVRTGIGAGREDVNVSCKGGTRVEIKGVAHTKWIPELTHNECFRQWALLKIRDYLNQSISDKETWKISHQQLDFAILGTNYKPLIEAENSNKKIIAVKLPQFQGVLSFFTQPEKMFADEISDRLKVIACLEKPNMLHSEEIYPVFTYEEWEKIGKKLETEESDARILFWADAEDVDTALETIEERCIMAFEGVPQETRKSFANGSTIFERVLPGADRMYPDTDSAPIPLTNEYIETLRADLPSEIIYRYQQMKNWGIPEDTFTYIFKKNLYPLIEEIITKTNIKPSFIGTLLGHEQKFIEGHHKPASDFSYQRIADLLEYLQIHKIEIDLAKVMLPVAYEHPQMDFDSILSIINFKRISKEEIESKISFLNLKFAQTAFEKENNEARVRWVMGQLHKIAIGNVSMKELETSVKNCII